MYGIVYELSNLSSSELDTFLINQSLRLISQPHLSFQPIPQTYPPALLMQCPLHRDCRATLSRNGCLSCNGGFRTSEKFKRQNDVTVKKSPARGETIVTEDSDSPNNGNARMA